MDLWIRLCLNEALPPELVNLVVTFSVYRPVQNDSIRGLVARWCAGTYTTEDEQQFGPISKWDTSKITDMSSLFYDRVMFNDDLSQWDVSQVTTMKSMFQRIWAFN